ncbi:hypothetical protein [Nocardia sp. NPDC059239]|uniref:hypothetical protein n=1 Tax=Nocardia sp. NPDC059239 TaxID=3346785 RepID=UPI0036C27BC2
MDRSPDPDFRALLNLAPATLWGSLALFATAVVGCSVTACTSIGELLAVTISWCIGLSGVPPLIVLRPDPLPWPPTIAVTAGPPLATLVLVFTLGSPMPATRLWPTMFMAALAMILGIRGRLVAALVMTVACSVVPLIFSSRTGQSVGYWMSEAVSEIMGLLLGIFLVSTIRPILHRIQRLRRTSLDLHADTTARSARAEHRQRHLAAIDRQARPLLDILAERALTESEQLSAANTEARLRSLIRAPRLVQPVIDAACDEARARGVHIVLIDDSGDIDALTAPTAWDGFVRAAAEELRQAAPGTTVTVRLALPHHRSRATIVTTEAGTTLSHIRFDDYGAATHLRTRTIARYRPSRQLPCGRHTVEPNARVGQVTVADVADRDYRGPRDLGPWPGRHLDRPRPERHDHTHDLGR